MLPPHGWAKDQGVVAPSVRPVHLPRSALAAGTFAELVHVARVVIAPVASGPLGTVEAPVHAGSRRRRGHAAALTPAGYAAIGLHVIRVHKALPQLGPVPAVVVLVVASATEGARGAGLLLQAEGCGRWSPNECLEIAAMLQCLLDL